jgi:hypothetical protein
MEDTLGLGWPASNSGLKMPLLRLMRAGRAAAAGLFFGVKSRDAVVEVVIDGADLLLTDSELGEALVGEGFQTIVPTEGEIDGVLSRIGGNGFGRGQVGPARRSCGRTWSEFGCESSKLLKKLFDHGALLLTRESRFHRIGVS